MKIMNTAIGKGCFVVALSMILATGCGVISDRSSEYVQADAGKEIVLPGGLAQEKIKPLYPIPVIENQRKLPKKFELPEPPDATAVLEEAPYLVESLGDEVWLKLYTSPGKVWPLLDLFLRDQAIQVQNEDIAAGKLNTSALNLQNNPALVNQLVERLPEIKNFEYMLSVDVRQGVRRNTTELHLTSVSQNNGSADESLSVSAEILDIIGAYITSSEIQNRHSLLATDIETESRVRLLDGEDNKGYLEIELSFGRAWSEVEQALNLAGIEVEDLNRSEGIFYLNQVGEAEDAISWLSFGSAQDSEGQFNYEIRLSKLKEGLIRVDVKVLNPQLDPSKHNELVSLLFEHIS